MFVITVGRVATAKGAAGVGVRFFACFGTGFINAYQFALKWWGIKPFDDQLFDIGPLRFFRGLFADIRQQLNLAVFHQLRTRFSRENTPDSSRVNLTWKTAGFTKSML